MNWKKYENQVFSYFKNRYPNSQIEQNIFIIGQLSKTKRQIDLLLEEIVAGYKIRIVIECKDWNKPLDVADVEQFVQKLNDVRISKGVIIAKSGYTKAAKEYIKNTGDINLHVLKFEDLGKFQGFYGFTYRGIHGAIVTPPNGWIIDAQVPKQMIENGGLCLMYPMELEAKDSFKEKNLIYFDITELDEFENCDNLLDIFLKNQEENIEKYDNKSSVEYKTENSKIGEIKIRITKYPNHHYTETAGFSSEGKLIVAIYGMHKHNEEEEFRHHIKFIFDQIQLITLYGSDPKNSHKDWSLLLNSTTSNAKSKTFKHN
ncbi:restriction endonuclease [Leptospira sp. WS60.C2]